MDAYSRSLQNTLSEQAGTSRLLLLSTFTALLAPGHATEFSAAHLIYVKPLTSEASAALVDGSLSRRSVTSPEFRNWCVRSGCGNPFFIVELASRALDDGSFTTPTSLATLIDSRLSVLSVLSRRVLQASCILGRHSDLATIEKVLGERRLNLLASLDELDAGGFIDHISESILSRHALITAAALRQASSASKALLHRYAAQTLQQAAAGNATILWDCAEHWRQAGDFGRAVTLMADCARHSLKMGLPLEAATMLEAAASLASDEVQVALLRDCTIAYSIAGAWKDAGRLAKHTVEAMKQTPVTAAALAEAEFVHLFATTRQSALTRAVLDKLLGFVASNEVRTTLRLEAATMILMEADNTQDKKLANDVYLAVLKIDTASPDEAAHHDHVLLIYHSSFGDARHALPAVDRLRAIAHLTTDFNLSVVYLLHAGHSLRVNGDVTAAHGLYVESYDISCAHYLYYRAEVAASAIVGLALTTGDLHSARRWCDLAKEESTKSRRGSPYPESKSYEAELYLRERKYDEARDLILSLREYSTRLGSVRARARQLALEADLKLSSGRSLSERECRDMLAISPKIAHAFRHDYFIAQLVRGLISIKRNLEAAKMLNQYLRFDRPSRETLSTEILELQRSSAAGEWSST